MIKDNRGITLIILIVTIIVLLILTSVITVSSLDLLDEAKMTSFVAEMKLIQKEVDRIVEEGFDISNLGEEISDDMETHIELVSTLGEIQNILDDDYSQCRYFSTEKIASQLNIENIKEDVIINFKTREVISMKGVTYNDKTYYTQYQLTGGQKITDFQDSETNLYYETEIMIDGLQAVIKIINITRDYFPITNYILKYKLLLDDNATYSSYEDYDEDSGYWIDIKNAQIDIAESGKYVIALLDNGKTAPYTQVINIELANKPKENQDFTKIKYNENEKQFYELDDDEQWYDYGDLPIKWAYAIDNDLKYYIWIPRFAYEEESFNIKFLQNTTNIATDNSLIPNNYLIPDKFENDDSSGIWQEVDGVINTISDIIEILEENE